MLPVALRKESVDRNAGSGITYSELKESLSARRAWIEILGDEPRDGKEPRRSPQGERG